MAASATMTFSVDTIPDSVVFALSLFESNA